MAPGSRESEHRAAAGGSGGRQPEAATASRARFVALGILCSRLAGLGRTMAQAHWLGTGAHADVLSAAMRLPNLLQNLLGDQAMAAAFIPVYSRMLRADRAREAARFAGAVFGLLVMVVAAAVLAGVALAPQLVAVFNAGFLRDAAAVAAGDAALDRYPRAVAAARLIFPMAGLLVLSAWAQGVLNSHRRFFLPYVAPVLWNAAIIGALVWAALGAAAEPLVAGDRLVTAACLGALLGGALQLAVQLPAVLRLLGGLRPRPSLAVPGVRRALRAFGPALAGRGVVQLSLYLDQLLASFLAAGALSALDYGGRLYALPLSVFAMSVAAAELPELARAGGPDAASEIGRRIGLALRQAAFVVVPAVVGYLAFGYLVVGLLLRHGAFDGDANLLAYLVLCGYTVGLLASMSARLLQNTFYALGDTRTPATVAAVRVLTSATLGVGLMIVLDRLAVADVTGSAPGAEAIAEPLFFGAVGLSLAAGVAAWLELALLRRALRRPLPALRLPWAAIGARVLSSLAAAAPAAALWWLLRGAERHLLAAAVLACYAALYLGAAWLRRDADLARWLGRRDRR